MPELKKLGSPVPFDSDDVIPPAFMQKRAQQRAA